MSHHTSRLLNQDGNCTLLSSPTSLHYLQCPIYRAPRCFKTLLIRSLELGERNFIPTNWKGFCDYFSLQDLKADCASELVEGWVEKHPYKHEHTLLHVVEYAQSTKHVKLLQCLQKTVQGHLVPEEEWTEDPANCFKSCHFCVPLKRTNSRSSENLPREASSLNSTHQHRRTHSLPKNIELGPQCHCGSHDASHTTPCKHTQTGSSVTNIFMSCNCTHSPFTSPTYSSPTSILLPHTLASSPLSTSSVTMTTVQTDTSRHFSSNTLSSPVDIPLSREEESHSLATRCNTNTSSPLVYSVNPPVHCLSNGQSFMEDLFDSTVHITKGEAASVSQVSTQECRSDDVEHCSEIRPRRRLVSESLSPSSLSRRLSLPPGEKINKSLLKQRRSSTDVFSSSRSNTDGSPSVSVSDSQSCYEHKHHATSDPSEKNTNIPVVEGLKQNEKLDSDQDRIKTQKSSTQNDTNIKQQSDVMHEFGLQLFDTAPYNIVRKFYNHHSRELIILILASFFLYNGFRCILQTMCEDGGLLNVFTDRHAMFNESTRKIIIFYLRLLTVVICPLCHCLHISIIAAKPNIPRTRFSQEEAIKRMISVHKNFSPHYEVSFIQARPQSVFQTSATLTKHHINSIWMSIVNCLLFPALLSYTGGVKLNIRGFTETGVCQIISASIVHIPFLNDDVHPLMVLDILLMLGVLLSIHTLKDYFYYENRIAVFAITIGGEGETLYQEIRHRWILLDLYCYLTAIAILICSLVLYSIKRTIISDPPSASLPPELLLNWFFWISVVSIMLGLGLSSNRLVKKTSLPAYLLVSIVLYVVNVNIDQIPPETMVVFFLISGAALVINLLFSLCMCHYYHYRENLDRKSLICLIFTFILILLLPLAVIGTLYREMVHLAAFVQW